MPSSGAPVAPSSMRTTKTDTDKSGSSAVSTALSVIAAERCALEYLEHVYKTEKQARESLDGSVAQIVKSVCAGGKCVVAGVGKSGKIGQKVVATMNSLGVQSAFLHPTEAIHGDLGVIGSVLLPFSFYKSIVIISNSVQKDTLLLISNSARTPELLLLVPHIPSTIPIIVMTSLYSDTSSSPLLESRRPPPPSTTTNDIILPTPVHETEQASFGVAAPMTSTTVALAVGDALALATAKELQMQEGRESAAGLFDRFHPGGVVGSGSGSVFSASFPSSWAATPETPDS